MDREAPGGIGKDLEISRFWSGKCGEVSWSILCGFVELSDFHPSI